MAMVAIRSTIVLVLALCAACMSATAPVVLAPKPVRPPYEQKMAWILRLEDQRMLRDPDEPPPPPPPPPPPSREEKIRCRRAACYSALAGFVAPAR
jgi:hypothetical protein